LTAACTASCERPHLCAYAKPIGRSETRRVHVDPRHHTRSINYRLDCVASNRYGENTLRLYKIQVRLDHASNNPAATSHTANGVSETYRTHTRISDDRATATRTASARSLEMSNKE